MMNLDDIMDLLDWNKSPEEQQRGRALARDLKCIRAFLQPCDKEYNKNVWENCAKILSEKTDEELAPYLTDLMEWLQDMNWPGAFCVLERLQQYPDTWVYQRAYDVSLKYARAVSDEIWEENLHSIRESSGC